MKNIYFLIFSGIFFMAADFDNFYLEMAFSFIGGGGIGLALRQARKKGYREGFKDGRGY